MLQVWSRTCQNISTVIYILAESYMFSVEDAHITALLSQIIDTALSSSHEMFQAALSPAHTHWNQVSLRRQKVRTIRWNGPACANDKRDNLSSCLIYFFDLAYPVFITLYYRLLPVYIVLILRYWSSYCISVTSGLALRSVVPVTLLFNQGALVRLDNSKKEELYLNFCNANKGNLLATLLKHSTIKVTQSWYAIKSRDYSSCCHSNAHLIDVAYAPPHNYHFLPKRVAGCCKLDIWVIWNIFSNFKNVSSEYPQYSFFGYVSSADASSGLSLMGKSTANH